MKINIASPINGTQKQFDIDDEKRLQRIHDKRLAQEFEGAILGDQFKGYVFKITGGQDKEGFPMKQGVLTSSRVRLLLKRGDVGFQSWRGRSGERRRKSVRGCIVGPDIAVLNVIVTKEGDEKLEGLTDRNIPRRLGPKRADKIRKLFNLTKEDDVRKYVIRRTINREGKKPRHKSPKIQRLITPITLERKRRKKSLIAQRRAKSQEEKEAYLHLLHRRRVLAQQKKRARKLFLLRNLRNRELGKIHAEETKKKKEEAAKAKLKPSGKKAAPAKGKPAPKGTPKQAPKQAPAAKETPKPAPKSLPKEAPKPAPKPKTPPKEAPKQQPKPAPKAAKESGKKEEGKSKKK